MALQKAVFFDRDNTLIVDKIYLNDPEDIEYLPHCIACLKKVRDAGFKIIIVTNQSGIARGIVDIKNLYKIHQNIRSHLSIQGIDITGFYYAPYSVESQHFMRKPKPGMLLQAARDHNIDLNKSWMVGDRASDITAGAQAGCRNIFLKITAEESTSMTPAPHFIANDLLEVADFITRSS